MGSTFKKILQWGESFGCWKGFVGYILQLYPGRPVAAQPVNWSSLGRTYNNFDAAKGFEGDALLCNDVCSSEIYLFL